MNKLIKSLCLVLLLSCKLSADDNTIPIIVTTTIGSGFVALGAHMLYQGYNSHPIKLAEILPVNKGVLEKNSLPPKLPPRTAKNFQKSLQSAIDNTPESTPGFTQLKNDSQRIIEASEYNSPINKQDLNSYLKNMKELSGNVSVVPKVPSRPTIQGLEALKREAAENLEKENTIESTEIASEELERQNQLEQQDVNTNAQVSNDEGQQTLSASEQSLKEQYEELEKVEIEWPEVTQGELAFYYE